MIGTTEQRLLVLGANGMLGNAVLRWFEKNPAYKVFGSLRNQAAARHLQEVAPQAELLTHFNVEGSASLSELFQQVRPQFVINCVGVVKQLTGAGDPQIAIPINALLPHRLARLCRANNARLIHVGTDCVFSGGRGDYTEQDMPDALDLYGRSKLMGEVDYPHAITLRTSIIGHELSRAHGLVGWFLAQSEPVRGFAKAIFSALPTVELARVIEQYVIPHPQLHGTYHVAGTPISKYELLQLVARVYGGSSAIVPDHELVIDRSLNGERFSAATGYRAPDWLELVERMRDFG